jgi:hypothetical protein
MATQDLLQSKIVENPVIYAYELTGVPERAGLLKVGYTTRNAETRVAEQCGTAHVPYKIRLVRAAMRHDGTSFDDHTVHKLLRDSHIQNVDGEWFRCSVETVERAIAAVQNGNETFVQRTNNFRMRPEQQEAVNRTANYFKAFKADLHNAGLTPHFLWNAKMRFGKTFTTYELALKMNWKKVLVLTFKPAVKTAWKDDLLSHQDFEGWQFCEKGDDREFGYVNERKPFVCFASFQDVLGRNELGGIKATNEWIQNTVWDCIVLDEYHFGAWGKHARDFYDQHDVANLVAQETAALIAEDATDKQEVEAIENYDEGLMPLQTEAYLYLSGTPFRAISSGEFIEEQIFNWTYSDEQHAKTAWQGKDNPYLSLPKMVMMTYQMPDQIREVAMQGEFDEFDLNEFFRADNSGFCHEEHVQKWLEWVRGSFSETVVSDLKMNTEKPPMPFSDVRLLGYLQHTYWFLPNVAACKAMAGLLRKRCNVFFDTYRIVVAAGNEAGMGADAVNPVYAAMDNPQKTKTITLSCGKLSTGVSIKPWTGILMLRNSTSPETYFQAAFRVQTPWTVRNEYGKEIILKPTCYVFDFAPNRALRQVAEYSCRLNVNEGNPERKVADFVKFLPILAYDGSSMKEIDAAGVLDMAMSGTTATLLARRWESAVLVNVDNYTLNRLLHNADAMRALMNIEGFRSLNQDIETVINKSEAVKKTKKEGGELSPQEKKQLTDEEREYKSKRKEIQEKLIKFATRIPVFMYLTDYREYCLRDVITQLEPQLFRKVTGLEIKDFELLVSLGVFNSERMNDAVYKFKRYEDTSLEYTGINTYTDSKIGVWDTVVERPETIVSTVTENSSVVSIAPVEEATKLWTNIRVGDRLTHKSFGTGTIKAIEDRYLIATFGNLNKKFLYPEAFEKGFLLM